MAALGDAASISGMPDGHSIGVIVSGFDADNRWRHAGGAEDWVVSLNKRLAL